MIAILLSIAPIFLLIVLGHGLRRGGIPSVEFWNLNDKLVYWVLFPSLLFYKTSTIELSGELVGDYAVVILGGFGGAVAFALLSTAVFRLPGPTATSVLQGAGRHNTFIALAAAERLYGGEGLAMAALATALLIPVTNITVVSLMVTMLRGRAAGGLGLATAIARDLARNPLLISVLGGVAVNLSGVGLIPVLHDVTAILGQAALPVVLLCVGANIRVREMTASVGPALLSTVGKMVVFPAVLVGLAVWTGLSPMAVTVAGLFGAVPTAASGYTLARAMGGDAPLMATIITVQTALAFVTLPLTVWLLGSLLG
ncbi:transporter [Thalassobaculum fulvum]|uniref:Transporter n=1 Tax=Thalassobaculum fulvum TaxID=1633335 RepID=A0A918XTN7_9PROT|nr:AEC family transporter [Thalassobaculum fulvum]GHD54701.1 transporter [Thalassobaculum fulvum]